MKNLKYDKAWDNELKRFVTVDEVLYRNLHDPLRYFSKQIDNNNIDNCDILTVVDKHISKSKKGNEFEVRKHFTKVQSYDNATKKAIQNNIKHIETKVHKLSKIAIQNMVDINANIKLPALYIDYKGEQLQLLSERYARILRVDKIEQKLDDCNRIPDAVVTLVFENSNNINKIKQILLEMYCTHAVGFEKRNEYDKHNKDCIEVNIYNLKDIDDLQLGMKLQEAIALESNWVTSSFERYFKENVVDITCLERSQYDSPSRTNRYYMFKDNLVWDGLTADHPCVAGQYDSINNSGRHSIDYGICKNCPNCVYFKDSNNINEVRILCDRYNRKSRLKLPVFSDNALFQNWLDKEEIKNNG